VRGETATPRRVSPALLDDCDKGTWNLSIYCNSSGRPSKAHVTPRDPTLDAVGTRSCAIRRGMSKNVQRQYLTCPSELVPEFPRTSRQFRSLGLVGRFAYLRPGIGISFIPKMGTDTRSSPYSKHLKL